MRWPLRYQILIPFAGLFLVVILLITAISAFLAVRASQRRTETQLREVAHTLLTSSFPLTSTVLRQTRGLSGAEFILTAPDGEVIASSVGVSFLESPTDPIARWNEIKLGNVETIGANSYFHTAIRLTKRADRAESGFLHVLYPEESWREARLQAIYPPLVLGGIALVAVGGLSFAIAARMSQPIQNLRMQVGALAAGKFQTISLPTRNDELRDLVDSVNRLAEQLGEMRRVIKRSERLSLLGQLASGVAHHLRNDVTGARMAIQLHERDCTSDDSETIEVALRQLTLAEAHLQQFLAAGQPRPPERSQVNLPILVSDLAALVGPTCKHRNVDLQVAAQDAADALVITADAEQLRQALLNLALNAIEAAGPGGWVRIECSRTDDAVRLRVLDSGPGVAAEIQDRLCEPFTTTKPEGVGLGLTVARQIAEGHGGTLNYHRKEATCFEIALPANLDASASGSSPRAEAALNAEPLANSVA